MSAEARKKTDGCGGDGAVRGSESAVIGVNVCDRIESTKNLLYQRPSYHPLSSSMVTRSVAP